MSLIAERGLAGTLVPSATPDGARSTRGQSSLAGRISGLLRQAGVRHCAWKSDPKVERFEQGEGDLDLLVARGSVAAVASALEGLAFRTVIPAVGRATPGVVSFVGPHPMTGTLLHVHVHFQLLVGQLDRRPYHLPIEQDVLQDARAEHGLFVAAPVARRVLAVLHGTLRRSARALLESSDAAHARTRGAEPGPIGPSVPEDEIRRFLARVLPILPYDVFAACERALRADAPPPERIRARWLLTIQLHALHRTRPTIPLVARALRALRRRGPASPETVGDGFGLLQSGGAVVALVGGDGSGKSTSARALGAWLAPVISVRHLHLGRPPRSLLTWAVGGLRRLALVAASRVAFMRPLAEHLELARVVCTARDRVRAHDRARRHAAAGGVALCERHPLAGGDSHAGPSSVQGLARDARSKVADRLRRIEHEYYARLQPPDLTLVLRLDPEIAVRRKPEEPAAYVRKRAREIFDRTWDRVGTRVVDASRPFTEVMRDLRQHVWEAL